MWQEDDAPDIAAEFVGGLGRRWQHVQTVGRLADTLVADAGVSPTIAAAAWLHDIGYAPALALTGFHPLDGAVHLRDAGAPVEIVGLVAHHTGAEFEADERDLSEKFAALPVPDRDALDVVTLVDLVTTPDGTPTTPEDRVAEILCRYGPDDPVHRAVTRSRPHLLASAARARARLGLADVWPFGVLEGVREAHSH